MCYSKFAPGKLGKGVGIPLNGATSTDKERRQAGTPATLEVYIDHPIDEANGIGPRPQAQPYPVKWLVSRHQLSPTMAALVAAELGMGGAS
jgi:hypothetical protein